MRNKMITTSLRIEPELLAAVMRKLNGRPWAPVVRRLLREWLELDD